MNSTSVLKLKLAVDGFSNEPPYDLVPTPLSYPFYYAPRAQLLSSMSDKALTLLVPIAVYWIASLVFTWIDMSGLPYFEKHRIHEPEEIKKRNKVTMKTVVIAVFVQQVFQTLLGMAVLDEQEAVREAFTDHRVKLEQYAQWVSRTAFAILGPNYGNKALRLGGAELTSWVYWWGVPIMQFLWASFFLDTWQYFFHRYFHTNLFLYRHIHSIHHRLYCPYSFGALYNHPVEGFLFDTLGTTLAQAVSFMTHRQAMVLFGVSSLKTIDDHCGFALPWDPCQFLFGNNAAYHDIHHQHFGIKKNFSQPYFTHWDVLLGTRMTAEQVPARQREKYNAGPVKEYRDRLAAESATKKED